MITVLVSAMDPIAQDIITYPTSAVLVGSASARRLISYNQSQTDPLNEDYTTPMLDIGMTVAIFQALYGTPHQSSVVCSTGNCLWELFSSLAVCSLCHNVTDLITKNVDAIANLPNGLSLPAFNNSNQSSPQLISSTSLHLSTELGPDNNMFNLSVLGEGKAYECSIYLCVNEYNTSMVNGALIETVTSSWDSSYYWALDDAFHIPSSHVTHPSIYGTIFSTNPNAYGDLTGYLKSLLTGTLP